jgi:hypothetical protein
MGYIIYDNNIIFVCVFTARWLVPLNLTIGTLSPTRRQTIKDSMDMVNLLWPKVENLVVIVVGVQVIGWGQIYFWFTPFQETSRK